MHRLPSDAQRRSIQRHIEAALAALVLSNEGLVGRQHCAFSLGPRRSFPSKVFTAAWCKSGGTAFPGL